MGIELRELEESRLEIEITELGELRREIEILIEEARPAVQESDQEMSEVEEARSDDGREIEVDQISGEANEQLRLDIEIAELQLEIEMRELEESRLEIEITELGELRRDNRSWEPRK